MHSLYMRLQMGMTKENDARPSTERIRTGIKSSCPKKRRCCVSTCSLAFRSKRSNNVEDRGCPTKYKYQTKKERDSLNLRDCPMDLNRVPLQVHLVFQRYNTNLASNLFAIF